MAWEMVDTEIILRLVIAAVASGLIGFEREKVHKPAGLRTLMLVGMGAALFVLVALRTIPGEVVRIMAGIATGIGFLGAGAIFKDESHVRGLTTAASIWAVAAIGITAGLGEYVLMAVATLLVFVVLELNRMEFFKRI